MFNRSQRVKNTKHKKIKIDFAYDFRFNFESRQIKILSVFKIMYMCIDKKKKFTFENIYFKR